MDAFVALKAGNTFTLPSYDSETGAWTDGSMYNKNANKTFTVKCWDPDGTTSAALLAY